MISGIYAILNIVNCKYYIGSAVDFADRWRLHKLAFTHNKHHNRHLQKAWNKYGEANFIFVVLEYTNDLDDREQYWIKELDAINPKSGYNICLYKRNRLGVKASEETRKRLSESHKGYKASEETKRKMSLVHKGNQYNKGKIQSKEHIEQRRKSNTGLKRSEEARLRMKESQKNRLPVSDETRLKMSEAAKQRRIREREDKKPLDYTCDMWV